MFDQLLNGCRAKSDTAVGCSSRAGLRTAFTLSREAQLDRPLYRRSRRRGGGGVCGQSPLPRASIPRAGRSCPARARLDCRSDWLAELTERVCRSGSNGGPLACGTLEFKSLGSRDAGPAARPARARPLADASAPPIALNALLCARCVFSPYVFDGRCALFGSLHLAGPLRLGCQERRTPVGERLTAPGEGEIPIKRLSRRAVSRSLEVGERTTDRGSSRVRGATGEPKRSALRWPSPAPPTASETWESKFLKLLLGHR